MDKKEEYIKYRIGKSHLVLDDARYLASDERWISAMNRLYYAAFYAVHALLLRNDLEAHTHNGVKTKFFQQFIKTGIFDKAYSDLYSDLFVWRQEGDYSDFAEVDADKVLPLIERVSKLICLIENQLYS